MKNLNKYLSEALIKKDTILKFHKYDSSLLNQKIENFNSLIDILKQYFFDIKYKVLDNDLMYVGSKNNHSYEVYVDKLIAFKFKDKILYVGQASYFTPYMNIGYYDDNKNHSAVVVISRNKTLSEVLKGLYEWINTNSKLEVKEFYNLFNYTYEDNK